MFFDTHAHLNDEKLIDRIEDVLSYMKQQRVDKVLVPAVSLKDVETLLDLRSYPEIFVALGIHPSEVHEKDEVEILKEHLLKEKVIAVGEIGLDYYWTKDNKKDQQELFYNQLLLAKQFKLPVIIHDRDAHEDVRALLKEVDSYEYGVIFHAYSGSSEMMREDIKKHCYISLAGPVTFKNARVPVEVAREIPLERLLIETDSPYLSPHPFRGKINDPSKVPFIAKKIAEIKGIEKEIVEKATYLNAMEAFNL